MNGRFQKAKPILERLQSKGFEAYFVGGAVRDDLMHRQINDVDIASNATPSEVKEIFPKHFDVGIQHGTIMISFEGETYEVTTFRLDGAYLDNRRPSEVKFVRNLRDDLERRDFTINAFAMDAEGKIFDYFNGQEDLKSKVIRAVNNPNKRFQEDALRMLRAIRFVSQLGFQLDQETMSAIQANAALIKNISQERITVEFEKTLMGVCPEAGITTLIEAKLHQFLFGLKNLIPINFEGLSTINEKWSYLIVSLQLDNENIATKEMLQKWKCPNDRIIAVCSIIDTLNLVNTKGWSNHLLFQAGVETAVSAEKIHRKINKNKHYNIQEAFEQLPIHSAKELAITGHDLLDWFNKPAGPWLGEILNQVISMILANTLENEKEQIREWLIQNKLIQS